MLHLPQKLILDSAESLWFPETITEKEGKVDMFFQNSTDNAAQTIATLCVTKSKASARRITTLHLPLLQHTAGTEHFAPTAKITTRHIAQ